MVVESGSFPSKTDAFPAGLRVLVVDDDLTWLKILEKMLKKCSYQVTTCCLAREALSLLRERRDGFDIVISDVNMPDMDGFKLLEHVGLEMDLPVIMMSVDWETSKVMKGVQHGACDYLLKPIKMKEVRTIWQHVVRKKIHEAKEIESLESRGADIQMLINGLDNFEDKYLLQGAEVGSIKRRKDPENKRHVDDLGVVDSLTSKKARVVWSVDLHRKFVDAVNQIDFDKVGPKKVLTLMNVPGLTRENVASHLQKYRLYLSRMQKEEARKQQQQDLSHAGTGASFGLENVSSAGQNYDAVTVSDFGYTMPSALEGDLEGIVSFMPLTEPETALKTDFPDQEASVGHQMGPVIQTEQWGHQVTMLQELWEPKQQVLEPYQHFQADPFALNPKSCFPERDKFSSIDMPSPPAQYSENDIIGTNLSSIALPTMNRETLEAVSSMTKWEPFLQEPISGDTKNALAIGSQNVEFSEYCYYNPEFLAELQTHCYDELGFQSDRFNDSIENPILEQGLFMV